MDEKLDLILERYAAIGEQMAAESLANDERVALAKEYAELTPVIKQIEALRKARSEAADLAELIADPDTDAEMRALANEEFAACRVQKYTPSRLVRMIVSQRSGPSIAHPFGPPAPALLTSR